MTWLIIALGVVLGLVLFVVPAIIEWTAWTLIVPGRRLPLRPVESAPWQPLDIRTKDGVTLAGAIYRQNTPKHRLLVILHGFAEDRIAMAGRATGMVEKGWDVLVCDNRAMGRSGGDYVTFGTLEAADLSAWLDLVGEGYEQVVVWGRSMGAAIALQAAGKDSRIHALILEAPYYSFHAALTQILARYYVPSFFVGLVFRRASRLANVAIGQTSSAEIAQSIQVPTMIIFGDQDRMIPVRDTLQLSQVFPEPASLLKIPDAHHTDIAEVAGPMLVDEVDGFLNIKLGKFASNL